MKTKKTLSMTLLVSFALLLAACGSSSSSSASKGTSAHVTTISVQYYPGLLFQQTLFVAIAQGYFTQHHVKVDLVPISSGPAGIAAVSAGSVDLASTDPDNMIDGLAHGLKLQAVSYSSGGFFVLIGNSSIPKAPFPQDLKGLAGKSVGVTATGADGQFLLDGLLAMVGIPTSSVSVVGVGTTTAITPFEQNRIQAYMGIEPVTTMLLKAGAHVIADLPAGQDPRVGGKRFDASLTFWGKSSFLNGHAAAIQGFRAALHEAAAFSVPAHLAQVTQDIVKESGIKVSVVPGGIATLKQIVAKYMSANDQVSLNSTVETSWLLFMRRYERSILLSGPYLSGNASAVMANSVWRPRA